MERGKERGLYHRKAGVPSLRSKISFLLRDEGAAEEEKDAASVLQYYRQLIALRKSDSYREAFTYGEFRPAFEDEKGIFAFTRSTPEQKILVAANYGTGEQVLELPSGIKKLLLSNNAEIKSAGNRICLGSCDAAVLELE